MPVFLDTNIFLYAAGGPHPEREVCIELLQRVSDGSLDATVSAEVVQEVMFVLGRRGLRDGLRLARDLLALFPGLLPVAREDMLRACGLLERYPRLPVDLDQVGEIRRVPPGSA